MTYSIEQFKAVLIGLGYRLDDSQCTREDAIDFRTRLAIQHFQTHYQLPITGEPDYATQAKARQLVRNLQHSLNLIVNAQLPINEYYGKHTSQAVKQFQQHHHLPTTGIATAYVRSQLAEAVKHRLRTQVHGR